MEFYFTDVFSQEIFSGNGLTVVFCEKDLESQYMLKLAQEFKQFETIYLTRLQENNFKARIFTVEEELDFAGHPILGAGAVIHNKYFKNLESITITLELNNKMVEIHSKKESNFYNVQMNQGVPQFLGEVPIDRYDTYLKALNLCKDNLDESLPLEIVSTGLPYLLVPLKSGIEKVKILVNNFEELLSQSNAKFVYVFDTSTIEARTWDNGGKVEDVATGSAAGPLGAYLYQHQRFQKYDDITIHQGKFLGRPSKIKVSLNHSEEILVNGDVIIMANGHIR